MDRILETRTVVQKRALRYTKARAGSTIRFCVCRCRWEGDGGRSGSPRRKEEPERHTGSRR